MNKFIKLSAATLMLWIYCFLIPYPINGSLMNIYEGITIDGKLYLFLLNYFLFTIYSFFIFETNQKYISGYGLFQLVRYQSREYLFRLLVVKLIKIVFGIECLKIFCYFLLSVIHNKVLSIDHLNQFVLFFISNIFLMLVFLVFQMLIEVKYSSRISLLLTQIMYILTLFSSDLLFKYFPKSILNYLLLDNYAMRQHYVLLKSTTSIKISAMTLIVILLMCILYTLGKHIFEKKDVL